MPMCVYVSIFQIVSVISALSQVTNVLNGMNVEFAWEASGSKAGFQLNPTI